MLGTHSLQSTSDQQDPVRYASIAAAAPTAVTPEQSAVWAYPQPGWSDEKNALTVVNSLLGRVHLSGRLDQLSAAQLDLIYGGMEVYKDIRGHLNTALPFWPIGLPSWRDDWHSLGLATTAGDILLAVWRIKGSQTCSLTIPQLKGASNACADLLYPANFESQAIWNEKTKALDVQLPGVTCARLYRLVVAGGTR
jgi:alpha-galactosidase